MDGYPQGTMPSTIDLERYRPLYTQYVIDTMNSGKEKPLEFPEWALQQHQLAMGQIGGRNSLSEAASAAPAMSHGSRLNLLGRMLMGR